MSVGTTLSTRRATRHARLPEGHKWLMAAYLLSSSRNGISARQLQRTLGVTYKTAWRMAHRIHEAMLHQNPSRELTAPWLQSILLGEQKRRNQEGVVVNPGIVSTPSAP